MLLAGRGRSGVLDHSSFREAVAVVGAGDGTVEAGVCTTAGGAVAVETEVAEAEETAPTTSEAAAAAARTRTMTARTRTMSTVATGAGSTAMAAAETTNTKHIYSSFSKYFLVLGMFVILFVF